MVPGEYTWFIRPAEPCAAAAAQLRVRPGEPVGRVGAAQIYLDDAVGKVATGAAAVIGDTAGQSCVAATWR